MAVGPHDEIYVLYSNYPPCAPPPFDCRLELSGRPLHPRRPPRPGVCDRPAVGLQPQQPLQQDEFELAVGPDGKPVVAAYGDGGVTLARFGLDGRLDPSFGAGGVIPFTGDHAVEAANDFPKLAVQPDGKVVLAVQGGARRRPLGPCSSPASSATANTTRGSATGGEAEVCWLRLKPGRSTFSSAPAAASRCRSRSAASAPAGSSPPKASASSASAAAGQPDPAWAGDGSLFVPDARGSVASRRRRRRPTGASFSPIERPTPTVSTVGNCSS